MKFNMQNMQGMLQQAQKMQEEMERMKSEVNAREVTADAGGGMVEVTMRGSGDLVSLKIAKEIVDPNEIEMLEDLVLAAVNKAKKDVDNMVSEEMGKLGGMMPEIPGMNLGF